jgi:glycosyltransferase involved in cell wall biosynthesis
VRVLLDYRSALRERSGVGEYTHQLARAMLEAFPASASNRGVELTLFSSSWKHRLTLDGELAGARGIDRRIPVRLLNLAWHRLGWPPVETLTGLNFDVTHSLHPLLLPARSAAKVITIHDLNFLTHPERTRAEIRRDYPALARKHAHRADRIIVPSEFTAAEVVRRLDVRREHIAVCTPGAPAWKPRDHQPANGYILFLGTLEPRKNLGGLLDAYERLLDAPTGGSEHVAVRRQQTDAVPELVIAGKATAESLPLLERLKRPPLIGHVRHVGYVDPSKRQALYGGARLLVQPSFEEGFGLPVLEAMTLGVPVVAANRGALPEVLGTAGSLVDPDDPRALAAAIGRLLDDPAYAAACAERGIQRAREFQWGRTATRVYETYEQAITHRRCESA